MMFRLCERRRSVTGYAWPARWRQIADYLYDQVSVTGHRTFPKSVLSAVQFLVKKGAVASEGQFDTMAALRNMVDSMTTNLGSYSPYTKKSPPLLHSMLAAMEHFVANASQPLFLGAYVWLTL
eukprot:3706882-Karenia_brevis.AAC.1